jgi:hypothetical protein
MQFAENAEGSRALAEVTAGERVEVVDIVFETIRELCPLLGINPGDVLRCEERTTREVLLRRGDGSHVAVDRFYASFVRIRAAEQSKFAAPAATEQRPSASRVT